LFGRTTSGSMPLLPVTLLESFVFAFGY